MIDTIIFDLGGVLVDFHPIDGMRNIGFSEKAVEEFENKIFSGLVEGRISKQVKEISLLDQTYVKAEDGKQIVSKYVEEVAKANNAKITIKKFVRFETGEGIEKVETDFAAEVAAQVAGAAK